MLNLVRDWTVLIDEINEDWQKDKSSSPAPTSGRKPELRPNRLGR